MADEEGTCSTSQPKRLKTGPRKYLKLPIEVCESHEDVLYHIQRAIASKYLPFQGITMVHLDSHPDLTIPMKMPADLVFEPERLFERISIADWILPAVYAGHISRLVWVKPEWADQMEEKSQQKFYVGKDKDTGYLRVSCVDDYYLEELLYAPQDQLENSQELELIMFTLKSTKNLSTAAKDKKEVMKTDGLMIEGAKSLCQPQSNYKKSHEDKQKEEKATKQNNEILEEPESEEEYFTLQGSFNIQDVEKQGNYKPEESVRLSELLKTLLSDNEPYILDIDMDFFSTKNPFNELFNEEEFQSLRQIYNFIPPTSKQKEDLDNCTEARAAQLACIDFTFEYFKTGGSGKDSTCEGNMMVNKQLLNLLEEMKEYGGEEPDLELMHSAGMTIDLPHHVSTKQEIDSLLTDVCYTLQSLSKPTMVTMARSAHDEYTPPHQVKYIQSSLISILGSVYGLDCIDIHLHYKEQV